jgi:hypothetical protein
VLTGFIRSLEHGPDHRYTLEARTSQGTDLRLCGDYEVALSLEKENCDRHRRVWGHADVRTLKVVNNLGEGLRITGRYLEAKRMHRFTVWERSRQLGPDDIWTNFARMNLAWDLLCLGRYEDARVELETVRSRVVDTGVRPSHQLVLFADRAFAIVLRKQGQYDRSCDAAAANYRECHEFLGVTNEATFSSGITYVNSLAAVDRIDDAADLAAEVRQSISIALGPENPLTLIASVNSAIVLRRQQRRWYEAAELTHHAHTQLNRRLGPDHPYTIAAANSLATDLFLSGSYRQASEVSAVALQHAKRRYLPRHPDRLVLTINAGLDLLAAGDQSAGNALRKPALDALAEVIGPTHPALEHFRASQRRDWEVEPPPL